MQEEAGLRQKKRGKLQHSFVKGGTSGEVTKVTPPRNWKGNSLLVERENHLKL